MQRRGAGFVLTLQAALAAQDAHASWTFKTLDSVGGTAFPVSINDRSVVTAVFIPSTGGFHQYARLTRQAIHTVPVCGAANATVAATGQLGLRVVGWCTSGTAVLGFLYERGSAPVFLQYPNSGSTVATGLAGETVAGDFTESGFEYGFLYRISTGQYVPVSDPDFRAGTSVNGISPGGVVFGNSYKANGRSRAFVEQDGVFQTVSLNGFTDVTPDAMNKLGLLAGTATAPGGHVQAFAWQAGHSILLAPQYRLAQPIGGITSDGRIAGTLLEGKQGTEGFVWKPLKDRIDLIPRPPNVVEMTVRGVNEQGRVTGNLYNADGSITAYIASCEGQSCIP